MYVKFFKTTLSAVLLLLLTAGVSAQATRSLTIDEAIDLGMKYNKQLKISQSRVGLSDAQYKQDIAQLAPAVAINSSVTHNSTNIPYLHNYPFGGELITVPATAYNYYLNRLNVSQLLFSGGRGINTLATVRDQTKAAQYDLAADKLTTRNNIITAYYTLYKLTESVKVVDENIKVLQQRLKDVQNLQTVGMALNNDVLQVQLSISSLQQNMAEVQSNIQVSNYNLDVMLGLPDTTQLMIVETGLISDKPAFDINSGIQTALVKRPEVKASELRLDISHKNLKIARGLYAPVITGAFNFFYDEPNQRVFFAEGLQFKNSYDIGVKLSWNITGLFTNQFQTSAAKIGMQQAEEQHEQLSDNIRMEVNANYSAYRLALDKIRLNQDNINQSVENRRMTRDQYENGVKNITDMLTADNLVIVSQINILNARIDAEIAYAKLLTSTGEANSR